MFFFKKKAESVDLSWLQADMHSHLVPSIDDGAKDLSDSLAMIRGLAGLGYTKLITTPHILWEMYPNTPERIHAGLDTVRVAAAEAGIGVTLHGAAEYFIDDHFDAQVRSKTPLLTLSNNLVLVEFSTITAPMELQEILFNLQMENYQPVIAHPERNVYLSRRKQFFDDLKSSGCYFQLNLLALGGAYGTSVQELADYLLKKDYYDLAGTDMHSLKHLEALKRIPVAPLKRLRDSGTIKNHLL